MPPRAVKVLHIEDDLMQQRMTAQQLKTLREFQFDIVAVDSEDGAVEEFQRRGPELVLLDYHLTQGNGLSCLHKLRERDRIVPIIAMSGLATPEIAAELLRVGADDYLSKQELTTEDLARSVRDSLARADAWRRAARPSSMKLVPDKTAASFDSLCQRFVADNAVDLLHRLDAFETAARASSLKVEQMQALFENACTDAADRRRLLRPLLLELILRLYSDEPTSE